MAVWNTMQSVNKAKVITMITLIVGTSFMLTFIEQRRPSKTVIVYASEKYRDDVAEPNITGRNDKGRDSCNCGNKDRLPLEVSYIKDDACLVVNKTHVSVICQLKDQLVKILARVLHGYDYVVLTGIPFHENKGDSAITIGELRVLAALNKKLTHHYLHNNQPQAYRIVRTESSSKDTVIVGQGGGNVGTWHSEDVMRSHVLKTLREFKYVLFSQSAHFFTTADEKYARDLYGSQPDMTVLLRDTSSLRTLNDKIPSLTALLAPDMAFGIGPIDRFFPPTLDIIWINRKDKESAGSYHPQGFPNYVSYLVSDWLEWYSPVMRHDALDDAFMITYNGLLFLQRGRVLVTDRLHGHIMAALLGMPTVILDNKIHKLTHFRDTWTRDLPNVVVAESAADAVTKALALLLRDNTTARAPGYSD